VRACALNFLFAEASCASHRIASHFVTAACTRACRGTPSAVLSVMPSRRSAARSAWP
jgi:hypothetical protein